jgi:hypothetical protein
LCLLHSQAEKLIFISSMASLEREKGQPSLEDQDLELNFSTAEEEEAQGKDNEEAITLDAMSEEA